MQADNVRVRRAGEHDRPAMLRITAPVWSGTDYVPAVWNSWLRDSRGYLSVAESEGEIIGLMHVEVQPDGVAWMEGIRVREDAQSRGVGLALLKDGISWARGTGCSAVRLATYGGNPASNRLALKAGLLVRDRLRSLRAEPRTPARSGDVRVATLADRERVSAFIWRYAIASTVPIYTEGWTAYSLTDERLTVLLATQAVLIAGSPAITGVAIATLHPERPVARLGYMKGAREAQAKLAASFANSAVRGHVPRISATVRFDRDTQDALAPIGLDGPEVHEMVVYEQHLSPD